MSEVRGATPPGAHSTSGQAIPFKRDAATDASAVSGGAIGVLCVSLLAIAAVLFIRKRLNMTPRSDKSAPTLLRVLETQRLGPRALLSVVEFSGGHYLIAQGEHGISCVATAPIAREQA